MRLGPRAMEALQAEITGRLTAGDELVVAGNIARKGTALLAEKRYKYLRSFFSEGFLHDAKSFDTEKCCEETDEWKTALQAGASALCAMGEGGVLRALWKMAEASRVGLRADLRKIPVRQETIEICERFDLNPYKLLSQGAVLIGIRGGEPLVQEYRRLGIPASVIGQANGENDRLLYSGENARYLERPGQDEILKVPGICGRSHG